MEIGKLVAVFEGETRPLDAAYKHVEDRGKQTARSVQLSAKEIEQAMANASRAGVTSMRAADLKGFLGPATAVIPGQARTISTAVTTIGTASRGTTQATKQAAVAIRQDLGGALSTLSPRLVGLAAAAGPLTAVAAALVAVGAATAGIYKLVVSSAAATGKLHDLSQQTGFAVETLSALQNAAETSGGSIESITSALFLFETKMGDAKDKTSETSKIFKALGIDTTNNEKALRQSITALLAMTNAEDQATIGKKLFGRSVKDLMGAIKEAGGLDAFLNKQLKDGTLITTEAARRGDQLSDSVTILGRKFAATGRLVADEFAPLVTDALSEFSRWLRDNQKELISTAKEVATLIRDISNLASFIYSISPIKLQVEIIRTIKTFEEDISGSAKDTASTLGASLFDQFRGAMGRGPIPTGPGGAFGKVDMSKVANQTKEQIAATAKGNIDAARQAAAEQKKVQDALANFLKGGGGGGGKGGGKAQKDELEALQRVLIALNTEFRKFDAELFNSANLTELVAEKEKILSAVMGQLTTKTQLSISSIKDVDKALDAAISSLPKRSQAAAQALREQAIAQFKSNEETRISGELAKDVEALSKDWRQEIENTRSGADQYTIAIQNLERAHAKNNTTMLPAVKIELEYAAAMQRTLALTRERRTVTAQTRPRFALEDVDRDAVNATRPRIATVDEQVMRERLAMVREQMQNLASDLTGVLDRALYDGISGGAKRGLQSLTLGLLDMIQQVILGKLKNALADALSGSAIGGGWIAKLLGIGVSAAAGGIGGGIGGGVAGGTPSWGGWGGYASGGYLPPGKWGMAGEEGPEPVYGGRAGMTIVPNERSARPEVHNHYSIIMPPVPQGGYTSPKSKRQMAEHLIAALQGAQT